LPLFNAGVIRIDVDRWRERSVSQRAIDLLRQEPASLKLPEQDALALSSVGEWSPLPAEWNAQAGAIGYHEIRGRRASEVIGADAGQLIRDAAIIHWTGRRPWTRRATDDWADLEAEYLSLEAFVSPSKWTRARRDVARQCVGLIDRVRAWRHQRSSR
jgi:lipopolysaccharide biosynthesis glycosyltransferase